MWGKGESSVILGLTLRKSCFICCLSGKILKSKKNEFDLVGYCMAMQMNSNRSFSPLLTPV